MDGKVYGSRFGEVGKEGVCVVGPEVAVWGVDDVAAYCPGFRVS